ncbi:TIR domain-containing protein [Heyndrickxia oleronia]|uniref:TIR domain-containing protein n=1 Tax=Heyndrickxia oleronia TaxID=38875 RepID=UPI00203B508B|nr:TIR domain-containing protein [Heyndrickxia oleronia]
MRRKCFISFKTEDIHYKKFIQSELDVDMIDKSLDVAIDSDNEEYIMRKIREDYLSSSTVTIHLIGRFSAENRGYHEQKYIKRELQASLYNGNGNTRNGILGIVLPEMYDQIYTGSHFCNDCNENHNYVNINNSTTIKEFSYNYYIPNNKCAHSEDDRYCVLVKWNNFSKEPNKYIEKAFEKRSNPIANKVKVYPS